jgi:hypothetical protein
MMPRAWLGENPPDGAVIYYMLGEESGAPTLTILDANGDVVREFSSRSRRDALPTAAGLNRFVWDLSTPGPDLGGPFSPPGPRAVPGSYQVRLTVGDEVHESELEIRKDPRLTYITIADLQEQFDFLQRAMGEVERIQNARQQIISIREQLDSVQARLSASGSDEDLGDAMEAVREGLTTIEGNLVNTQGGGWESEPQIQGHLTWVLTAASSQRGMRTDARPTDQLVERLDDLVVEIDQELAALAALRAGQIHDLNGRLEQLEVPAIAAGEAH